MGSCIRRAGNSVHVADGRGGHDNDSSQDSDCSEAESEDCNISLESWSLYRTKAQLLHIISIFEVDDYIWWCRDWGHPWVYWDEDIREEVYFITNKEHDYYNDSNRFRNQ